MSAEQLVSYITSFAFLFIFLVVVSDAIRTRRSATIDASFFFGALALIVSISLLARFGVITPNQLTSSVISAALLLLPYLQLRMVDDIEEVPRPMRAIGAGIGIGSAAALFLVERPYGAPFVLVIVAGFIGVQSYCTYRVLRSARGTVGVTRGRALALALGAAMLVIVVLIAGLQAFFPAERALWRTLSSVTGVACGLGYFIGFAPPPAVRRLWQAPAIRQFLSSAARMPTDQTLPEMADALQRAVSRAIGAQGTEIAGWDPSLRALAALGSIVRFPVPTDRRGTTLAARVFREQRPLIVDDAGRADPANVEAYRSLGAVSLILAPITIGDQRFGVVSAYADRPARFTPDDLDLLTLLADEIAGVLQRYQLTQAAAYVRAQQEATQLKDEFLSAAAHDLRTPLTVILAQAQLLARRLARAPGIDPADLAGIDRLVTEAKRMRRLTDDVLDASRSEATGFVRALVPTDIVALAQEVAAATDSTQHTIEVSGSDVVALVDPDRIRQVMQNMVDNSLKFSPNGGRITITCTMHDGDACFTVEGTGIGIPPWDLPHLFQRFYRGGSSGERGFSGMGIGLFLCKRIVEEHDGAITAESVLGEGTRFHVRLPQAVEQQQRRANAAANSRG